jgi:hypothetical protein
MGYRNNTARLLTVLTNPYGCENVLGSRYGILTVLYLSIEVNWKQKRDGELRSPFLFRHSYSVEE